MLLAVRARLLFVPGARTPAYRALVIAVSCLLAADLVYAAVASTYDAGQWLDAVWLLSLLVLLRLTGLVRQTLLLRVHERQADQLVRDVVRDLDAVVWEAAGDARPPG